MPITKRQLWNQCQQAAAHLEKVHPGWAHEVDLRKLDMGHNYKCIVGQVAKGWPHSCTNRGKMYEVKKFSYAFCGNLHYINECTRYWITLVKKYRKKSKH